VLGAGTPQTMWLTDKEREENADRDRAAQSRGYTDDYSMQQAQLRQAQDRLVESARRKLTREEFDALVAFAQRR
jgi:hypothetical protein